MMRIAETFASLQGEGLLTGTPSFFIRVSGCHLRCGYCDTKYACEKKRGEERSVASLLSEAAESERKHVVITGGEPMLFSETISLTEGLKEQGKHITIETSGTLHLPVKCDLMSISPKLTNSMPSPHFGAAWRRRHEERRWKPDVLATLTTQYDYQLKFVVQEPADCDEVRAMLQGLPEIDPRRVLLMPEGVDSEKLQATGAWLEPHCHDQGFRFCPRRHIEWFGAVRGT